MLKIEKLSEKNLFDVICHLFPDYTNAIESQKRIKTKLRTFIPDYYLDTGLHKFMFEFDGPTHFTRTNTQLRDIALHSYCTQENIILVRIPYFLQIDDGTLNYLFGQDVIDEYNLSGVVNSINTTYKSGFHDTKIIYPSDFNPYGFKLFHKLYVGLINIDRMSVAREIYDSLFHNKNEIDTLGIDFMENKDKFNIYNNYPT